MSPQRASASSPSGPPQSADFVIVGAGVMGASVAFHLARRKAGRVVIVDKDHAGQGASGRSSALIRMHYTFPLEVQLAVKSLEIFRHWEEIVGGPGDFRKTGFVRIVLAEEVDRLRANVAMQQKLGVNTRLVTPEELQEIEPDWYVEDVVAAAYEPESGYSDGASVANGFLDAARRSGACYLPRTRVTAIGVKGDRVTGITTDKGNIAAPCVVVTTGQWTAALFAQLGVRLPLEAEFHEVAILKNPPEMRGGGCACIDSISNVYFRSDAQDKTLVGTFHGGRGVDPDNFPQKASEESLADMAKEACHRIPALQHAGVMRGITGVYDMSPDARPLLGEVGGISGLHLAAGFSGMGFKISPAVGLTMSELLLDGRGITVDISAFRPARFVEGQPIRALYEYHDD
jgi:sarcosine oxidase subunit beta